MHFIIVPLLILTLVSLSFVHASSLEEDESIFYTSSSPQQQQSLTPAVSHYAAPLSEKLPDQFWGITNEELEDLFAHSNDLVCIIDYGGKLIRVNNKWQEILGYESEYLTGAPYSTFIHPKDREKTSAYENKLSYAGLVNRYRCRNGLYRWLDWIGIPNKSRDSHLKYRFALARDITVHKLYERELSKRVKAKTKLEGVQKTLVIEAVAAVQAAQVGDLMSAEGGGKNARTLKVILQNFIQLTESSFGFIGEIFYDTHQKAFFRQHWRANTLAKENIGILCADNNVKAADGIGFDPFLKKVVQEQKPLIFNDLQQAFEGHDVPPAYRSIKTFLGIPLFSQGTLTGVIGLSNHQDLVGVIGIANRSKGYQESLLDWLKPLSLVAGKATGDAKQDRLRREIDNERQQRIRAEEANYMKSLFIAHMSHEIRTPLTSIIGNLELIQTDPLSQENLQYLKNAQLSAQSLLYISNDILDVAKLDAGIFKLEEKEFTFRKVLQETLDIFRLDLQAKKIDLHTTVASDIPKQVKGDASRLRQIVFNLLNNAVKFTNSGSIKFDFQGQPDSQKQGQILISGHIQDTGIGMNSMTLSKLFKPFSQGDDSLYRQFGGTGLGLHITRQICEAMGGSISVQSQIDHGSTFSFKLTLRQIDPTSLPTSADSTSFPILNILVAEDNAMIQKVFQATLSKLGSHVTIAPNGFEALEAVKANSYDVVLMDGEMPIMDGLEATRQIRQYLKDKPLPIIGVTAHALASDRTRFLDSGMNGYLTKPVKLADLKVEILRCLALCQDQK